MKKHAFLISVLITLILPAIVFSLAESQWDISPPTETTEPATTEKTLSVRVLDADKNVDMELETYIASVLYGEMPSGFDMEALKAQAVAIRTYTLRQISVGGKHAQAQLCTDAACCQAFAQQDTSDAFERIMDAVTQTQGEVLYYDGELIEATYFSCSGGRTEAAVEVWGSDIPYLQARDSPGEENAVHYQDTVMMSNDAFYSKLGLEGTGIITDITYTAGGGVKTISIGNVVFSGTQLRELLGLRSTAFIITPLESSVVITTKGFGHRVGMSQYGAEAMAVSGSTYHEILSYYYPGTDRKTLSREETQRIFDKAEIL